jgi:hypothetical protein
MGSEWFQLDDTTVQWLNYLWARNQSGFIKSDTFREGSVYVNFDNDMAIYYEGLSYAIAYC